MVRLPRKEIVYYLSCKKGTRYRAFTLLRFFVYIIRVHGNANNAFNRWGAKRVKDHKRYLYNLAKKKGVQRDEKMYFSMAGAGNRRRAV